MTEGKHSAIESPPFSWIVIGPRGEVVCSAHEKYLAEIIAEALDRYRAEIDERLQP